MSRTNQDSLGFEQLEARELLAGDVLAEVSGGVLTLTGDAADNSIRIVDVGEDGILLRGVGTTVNGKATQYYKVTFNDMLVSSLAGNDNVYVSSENIGGKLTMTLGDGTDNVRIESGEISGDVSIDGGSGNNNVRIIRSNLGGSYTQKGKGGADLLDMKQTDVNGIIAILIGLATAEGTTTTDNDRVNIEGSTCVEEITFLAHDGADGLVIKNSTSNGLVFNGGFGNDDVSAFSYSFGATNNIISLGNGVNTASLLRSVGDEISITGAAHKETIEIASCHFGSLNVSTAGGNDAMIFTNDTIDKVSVLNLGEGNDNALVQHSQFGGKLSVDLGNGNDDLAMTHSQCYETVKFFGRGGVDRMVIVNNFQDVEFSWLVDAGDQNDYALAMGNVWDSPVTFRGGTGSNGLSNGVDDPTRETNVVALTYQKIEWNALAEPIDWKAFVLDIEGESAGA
jgi:type VI protein secretion system component Hcp